MIIVHRKTLTELYKRGLISHKPYRYFEIKDKVDQYCSQGMTKTEAIIKTASLLECTKRTIYEALRATKDLCLR